MNKTLKNVLGVVAILVLLGADGIFFLFAQSYQDSVRDVGMRQFYVSGEGEVVAVPDVAAFNFAVITEGQRLDEIQTEAGKRADKLISFLKDQNVKLADIKTTSYFVSPRYQHFNCPSNGGACPQPKINGYTINKQYSVKIKDLAQVNAVMEGVVSRGADEVSGLSFTIDDPVALQAEARAKAIKQAQEKALQVAAQGGFKVGRLMSINESGMSQPPMYSRAMMAEAVGGGIGAAPTIEPGSQEVRVNVELTFEIK